MTSKELVKALKPLNTQLFITYSDLGIAVKCAQNIIDRMCPADKVSGSLVLYSLLNTISKLANDCED